MAKLLANENIPLSSVRFLEAAGHDVVSVTETSLGVSDTVVLQQASEQGRILVTFDRDYGELVYLRRLPCPPAIILLRFTPTTPEEAGVIINGLLSSAVDIDGYFLVLDRDHVRQRPLPSAFASE